MKRMLDLVVPAPKTGERLDRFLAVAQTNLSRSRVQDLIRAGRVLVNGRPARASHRLRAGDRILVELPPPRERGPIEPEALPLDIVFEDEWMLVINKPAGLVVHPGAGVQRGTLVHALIHHHPAIAGVGGEDRPGIVHRLDKDTSGLMVVAKSEQGHRRLVDAIRARSVRRVYRALVWGVPRVGEGRIEAAIGRDLRNRRRMAVVRRGGKSAVTRWRLLEPFVVASELEVSLETGRTHQIRVHLAHLGHPVVGDPSYGGRGKKLLSAKERERSLANDLLEHLPRQALHASVLEFSHPITGRALRFTAPIPDDYAHAIDALRAFRGNHRD